MILFMRFLTSNQLRKKVILMRKRERERRTFESKKEKSFSLRHIKIQKKQVMIKFQNVSHQNFKRKII